jgi:hypothetical protein
VFKKLSEHPLMLQCFQNISHRLTRNTFPLQNKTFCILSCNSAAFNSIRPPGIKNCAPFPNTFRDVFKTNSFKNRRPKSL